MEDLHKELVEIKEPAPRSAAMLAVLVVAALTVFLIVSEIGSYFAKAFAATPEEMYQFGVIVGSASLFSSLVVVAILNEGCVTIHGLGVEKEE